MSCPGRAKQWTEQACLEVFSTNNFRLKLATYSTQFFQQNELHPNNFLQSFNLILKFCLTFLNLLSSPYLKISKTASAFGQLSEGLFVLTVKNFSMLNPNSLASIFGYFLAPVNMENACFFSSSPILQFIFYVLQD